MKKIMLFLVLSFSLIPNAADARDIKQSTAANVMMFMTDSTDHVSGKAALTLTITASKDGAAFAAITPTVTERGSGWYNLALTTTDTNTLGDLCLHITATGADPTDIKHTIVANVEADTYAEVTNASYGLSKLVRSTTPANTLDVAATGEAGVDLSNVNGTLDATEIGTGAITNLKFATGAIDAVAIAAGAITSSEFAQSAADLVWSAAARTITGGTVTTNNDKTGYSLTTLESSVLHSGTAQAGAAGSITLAAGASATTDLYKGLVVKIYGGTGVGQARTITAYDGTIKVATVSWNWTTAPDATSTYAIVSAAHPSINSSLQVSTTASDPWATALPGAYGTGTAGKIVGDNLNTTVSSRSTLTDAAVWSYVTRTLTSGGYSGLTATDVDLIWDEAQSGHTTAGTFGKYLDEAISGLDDNPWDNGTRTITGGTITTNSDKIGYSLTATEEDAIVDKVWDEARSGHTTLGTFGQGVASVQGNVTGSVNSVTSGVTVSTNNDKTGYSLTQSFPTNFASLAIDTNGRMDLGKWLGLAPNTLIGGRVDANAQVVGDKLGYSLTQTFPANFSSMAISLGGAVTVGTNNDKTGYSLTSAEQDLIIDKIWDEAIAGHLTAGTTGNKLNAAGGAGDPWSITLPGSYGAGTAGKILSDVNNATNGTTESGSYTGIENMIRIHR